MKKEIWKDVFGYEGLYQISNFGNLKSMDKIAINPRYGNQKLNGKTISTHKNKKTGYISCKIYKGSGAKTVKIHRLVAQSFIPNPYNKPQVNHKNGVKSDNNVKNLEWVTARENQIHAYKIGLKRKLMLGVMGYDNNCSKQVLQYSKDGKFIREFGSQLEANRETGVYNTNISSCCLGMAKTAGGYIWKFK